MAEDIDFAEIRRRADEQRRREEAQEPEPEPELRKRERGGEWFRERHRRMRAELLDRAAPDRRCASCGEPRPQSNRLTVVRRTELAGMTHAAAVRARAASREGLVALCIACKRTWFPEARTVKQGRR